MFSTNHINSLNIHSLCPIHYKVQARAKALGQLISEVHLWGSRTCAPRRDCTVHPPADPGSPEITYLIELRITRQKFVDFKRSVPRT